MTPLFCGSSLLKKEKKISLVALNLGWKQKKKKRERETKKKREKKKRKIGNEKKPMKKN